MQIIRVKSAQEGAQESFKLLQQAVKEGAEVFGLATGSTPIAFYDLITASNLDFTNKISINLDEYVGLSGDDNQSYRYFMNAHLFNAKPFQASYLPDGKAQDLVAEAKHYDQIIDDNPVDFQILGIGANGHIGFNEPGTSFDELTHVVDLTESTIQANARFFENEADVPRKAISMGIASIMKAKRIVLMAYGESKAEAVRDMIKGPVTESLPASVLQNHAEVIVVVDEAAASLLD